MGRFWSEHLPLEFAWAPSLYAFLYPEHPYLDLNPVLRELYTTSRYYPTITPFPQGHILHSLVLEHNLKQTLEVGLAFGGSALFFCAAHQKQGTGHHFAVDPFQGLVFKGEGLRLIDKAGLSGFLTWLPAKAQAALPALGRAGLRLDLIYIDGDHSVPAVLSDFLQANDLLRAGGFLAFDDSHVPSGQRILSLIQTHFPYETVETKSTDRLTILAKRDHSNGPIAVRMGAAVGRGALTAHEGRRMRKWRLD